MTHGEIYINFKVEYDKLSGDSIQSYPSFTDKEIAIILNKAYLAIIAQKLTGNNPRQIGFEADNKAIEDIRPLLTTTYVNQVVFSEHPMPKNAVAYIIPKEMLYYIQSNVNLVYKIDEHQIQEEGMANVKLVTHDVAQKYMYTVHNKPWIEQPVCYIEENKLILLIDERHSVEDLLLTYIKKPIMFGEEPGDTEEDKRSYEFELSDTMAQELINLAIIMAAETVESPRMVSKNNIRQLES